MSYAFLLIAAAILTVFTITAIISTRQYGCLRRSAPSAARLRQIRLIPVATAVAKPFLMKVSLVIKRMVFEPVLIFQPEVAFTAARALAVRRQLFLGLPLGYLLFEGINSQLDSKQPDRPLKGRAHTRPTRR